jgi:DNA-binding response OmpR family regulator
MLEGASYRVVAVEDGRAAICQLSANIFDVVITDVLLPDIDGLEVIAAAERVQPNASIVAMSGGSVVLDADFCLDLVARISRARVLPKPFSPKELLVVVAGLLRGHRLNPSGAGVGAFVAGNS